MQAIGLARGGEKHGALEDAWLALMAYFWLQNVDTRHIQSFARANERGAPTTPTNFKLPPPLPDGPIPRRRRATTNPARKKVVDTRALAAKTALLEAVRPTATLLLEIARADEHLAAAEVDVLVGLIRATRDRIGVAVDGEAEIDVLGDLFDMKLRPNLLTDAARALCADPAQREAFPKLVATLARADGSVSESERAGIDRVKAAIANALLKLRTGVDESA